MTPATRARLCDLSVALQDLLLSESHRSIARRLGCSPSTPAERGARPEAWPIDALLDLAEASPRVADALRALFAAAEAEPTPCTAERATASVVRAMGAAVAAIMDRLDGGLDDGELRDTESDLANLAAQVSQARALIRRRRRPSAVHSGDGQ